ncbi:hypothetical protein K3495_g3758 [Podosphaera aphanis]|nr:hypothetical protein K3495_g3758 [Podosphaera aphanis]
METSWQPLSDLVSGNLSEYLTNYPQKYHRRPKPSSKENEEARAAAKVSTKLPVQLDSTRDQLLGQQPEKRELLLGFRQGVSEKSPAEEVNMPEL